MSKVTVDGSYIVALVMDKERIPLEEEIDPSINYHTIHGGKGSNMAAWFTSEIPIPTPAPTGFMGCQD
jgi:hypothetical protein